MDERNSSLLERKAVFLQTRTYGAGLPVLREPFLLVCAE
jgi:hypothetical protein